MANCYSHSDIVRCLLFPKSALLGFALRFDRCCRCGCNSMPDKKNGVWLALPAPSCFWLDDNVQRLGDRNILVQSRLNTLAKAFSMSWVLCTPPLGAQLPFRPLGSGRWCFLNSASSRTPLRQLAIGAHPILARDVVHPEVP